MRSLRATGPLLRRLYATRTGVAAGIALAALALASTIVKIDSKVLAALAAFQGLPHRMERVAEIGGIVFVNDSKGTTVAATLAALEGIDRPVVLIAGGDGKGQDFAPLKRSVTSHCRAVVLIGRMHAALIFVGLMATYVGLGLTEEVFFYRRRREEERAAKAPQPMVLESEGGAKTDEEVLEELGAYDEDEEEGACTPTSSATTKPA